MAGCWHLQSLLQNTDESVAFPFPWSIEPLLLCWIQSGSGRNNHLGLLLSFPGCLSAIKWNTSFWSQCACWIYELAVQDQELSMNLNVFSPLFLEGIPKIIWTGWSIFAIELLPCWFYFSLMFSSFCCHYRSEHWWNMVTPHQYCFLVEVVVAEGSWVKYQHCEVTLQGGVPQFAISW